MSKSLPTKVTSEEISTYISSVAKGKKNKKLNILPSEEQAGQSIGVQLAPNLEEDSETKKKITEEQLLARFEKIATKASEYVQRNITRRVLSAILRDRVLEAANQKFAGAISPAELDKLVGIAVREAEYELGVFKDVPISLSSGLMKAIAHGPFTLEPEDVFD